MKVHMQLVNMYYTVYNIVILICREKIPGEPETAQKVLLVTPELTSVLECTESSQTFSDKVRRCSWSPLS
jgi:hypothetical protein